METESKLTRQIAINLEASLLEDLQKIADQHHVTLSGLISAYVQAQLINTTLLEGLLNNKDRGNESIGA
ncbi:MAG: hypothetical protein ACI4NN_07615 [Pyramidobacter sp.]